ncbi:hypothetical protein IQ249_01790 [Lusitaniella coriacea LEGE 07157]|uniref:Uncharacterized protein n=1 Tax=Lusitaniella coriacea LEGE 07157 TaxID=945747 RepID=A0A8J7AMK3_9CYAN|nr:hypothetical protein [Lusitaniella coriacea LEGE 07157]
MQVVCTEILSLAKEYQGDGLALLSLLRNLENLHRTINEELFQTSLPNSRHELYNFLRDIEETGGWPYIGRMKLRALLKNFESEGAKK